MRLLVAPVLLFLLAASPAVAAAVRTGRADDGTVFRLGGRTLTVVLPRALPGTPASVSRAGFVVFCGTTRANAAFSRTVRARDMRTLVARLDRTPLRGALTCGLESKTGHDFAIARLPRA